MERYVLADMNKAPSGLMKMEWARAHMPLLNMIYKEFARTRPFYGLRIAMSMHLEAKTAFLAEVLRAGGAEVAVSGSNPLSTQDDVAAALAQKGLCVYARHGVTQEEYEAQLLYALACRPQIIVDDGGDLVHLLHTKCKELAENVWGGCEETTTGINRLVAKERAGELLFPVVAVNNARMKYLFDNRYGTGESVWSGVMRTTNLVVAGKTVVVIGYGMCGKGIVRRATGLGARVVVCEVDPIRAMEAHMDGHRVLPAEKAAVEGDFFITVTGCRNVLRERHFCLMKDGAVLANAGHFNVEIDGRGLARLSRERRVVRDNIEEYTMPDGRRLYLLAQGRLVNLAAGDGHPAEIMDLSFALQALCIRYLCQNKGRLGRQVYRVPEEVDRQVAEMKLKSLGLVIDSLTQEQREYLRSPD